jgi:exopolysaccharide production protein ExoZ
VLLAVPVLFLGYLVQRRYGPAPLVLLLVALIALSFSGRWSKLIGANALGYLHTFVFGLLVPTLGRALVERLTRRQAGILMALLAAAFLGAREVVGYASNWTPIVEAATSFLLLAGIAYRGELALFRPLDWKLAHFYGRISFSFYLVHPITLIVVWKMPETVAQWLAAGVPSLAVAFGLGVLSALAVTPLAALCFHLFEAPGMRLIRRLG